MDKTEEVNAQKLSALEELNNGHTLNLSIAYKPLGLDEAAIELYHTTNVAKFVEKLQRLPEETRNSIMGFFDEQNAFTTYEKWLRLLALRQALLLRAHYNLHGLMLVDEVSEDVMQITKADLYIVKIKGNKDLIDYLFDRIRKEYLATQIDA